MSILSYIYYHIKQKSNTLKIMKLAIKNVIFAWKDTIDTFVMKVVTD